MISIRNSIKENISSRAFIDVCYSVSIHVRQEQIAFNISSPTSRVANIIFYNVYDRIRRGGEAGLRR